jgi:hypothetical protein
MQVRVDGGTVKCVLGVAAKRRWLSPHLYYDLTELGKGAILLDVG